MPAPHQTADFHIIPLTADHARQILRWRYQPPYDLYNSPDTGVIEQEYIGLGMRPNLTLALYKQFGFQEIAEFTDPRHAIAYTVLNLDVTTRC